MCFCGTTVPDMGENRVCESYIGFAEVYDVLMDNVPYEEWAAFVADTLREYGVGNAPALEGDSKYTGKKAAEGPGIYSEPDGIGAVEKYIGRISAQTVRKNEAELTENLAVERNTVLDLGCGTGTLTELLARAGFEMIGIDNSEEMLEIALQKKEKSGSDILYLCQDMREFELYGTVGAVCSVCDSLNYILEDADMVKVFSLVNNYLYPGGIFVFDFNTVYKYEHVIGDATIAENREDCSFIWENFYDAESQVNEYDLTIFVKQGFEDRAGRDAGTEKIKSRHAKEGDGGGLFRRFTETHYQRGYTPEQMKGFLEKAGLFFVRALDADTHGEVRPESERVYMIAREAAKAAEEQ